MAILPCKHEKRITDQVAPTIKLLTQIDELHPEILLKHGIQPIDYHGSLVFRSAVESIRGKYIAASRHERENLVENVLKNLVHTQAIQDYKSTGTYQRYDFEIALQLDSFAAIEVKGGEGNSINISNRPLWAKEFGIWCHLNGAIVNEPEHGVNSIINRITNELVRRGKQVDVLFIKDILCGTPARPCPKYPGQEDQIGLKTAPDIFLFPMRRPIFSQNNQPEHDSKPPVHSLDTLKLPAKILTLFNITPQNFEDHIRYVQIEIEPLENNRFRRIIKIFHKGVVINTNISRVWSTIEHA